MTDRPWSSRKAGGGPRAEEPYVQSTYACSGLHLVCERVRIRPNQHEPARARNPIAAWAVEAFPSYQRSPRPVS